MAAVGAHGGTGWGPEALGLANMKTCCDWSVSWSTRSSGQGHALWFLDTGLAGVPHVPGRLSSHLALCSLQLLGWLFGFALPF